MKSLLLFAVMLFIFTAPALAVVNINTASQAELESLQGIGPAKAKAIIEYREKHGAFTSTEGLVEVNGIGAGTIELLSGDVTVKNIETSATAAMTAQQE